MGVEDRESAQIKFRRVDDGPDIYSALIYVDDRHFGSIRQRRGGPYEAFFANNRLIGSADTLSQLREKVAEAVAESAVTA